MIPAETVQRLAEAIWWDQLADMTVEELDELGHTLVLRHTLELIAAGWRQADIAALEGVSEGAITRRLYPVRKQRRTL